MSRATGGRMLENGEFAGFAMHSGFRILWPTQPARRDPRHVGRPQDAGSLEAVDGILSEVDSRVAATGSIIRLLTAQITLRNKRRLQARRAPRGCSP